MKCDEIRELISCMLDSELNEADSAEVTAHLARCPECMRVFEAFHAISLSLDEMEEVPEGFTRDVMSKVRRAEARKKTKQRKTSPLRFVRTAAVAACAALMLLAGTQFMGNPLYTGNGGTDVANFLRSGIDGQFTPVTPAPTEELLPGDENNPNAGLSIMSLEDEPDSTQTAPVTSPVVSALPAITPTPVPAVTPTPGPIVTPTPVPGPVLSLLTDLLVVLEPAQPGKFASPPAMELTVTADDGTVHALTIWADGNRLYCENRTNGTAYYTIGTPDRLQHLTGLPVAQTAAEPAPAP